MDILIDERLRHLRREKGNTQQELAAHLGISVQAVSKWERNEGYPDISMLPRLAAYYGTSVDDLLGVGEGKRREQIEYYLRGAKELPVDSPERVAFCGAAYREFPNEPEIVNIYLAALYHEGLEQNRDEILRLARWLLEHYNQSGQYFGAVRCLCHLYGRSGDMESAKKYATMGGRFHGTETQLLIRVLQGEEAVRMCRSNIAQLVDLIAVNAGVMLEKGEFDPEKQVETVEFVCWLYEQTAQISEQVRGQKWQQRLAQLRQG